MSRGDELELLLPEIVRLARTAGEVALGYYARGVAVRVKADASPVTEADEAAEAVILAGLGHLSPGTPIVSEECVARGEVAFAAGPLPPRFFLVDPIDGTREFVARNDEFTINIALVEARRPVLGVVHVPVKGITYAAGRGAATRLDGAERPIRARTPPAAGLVVVASRHHGRQADLDAYLEELAVVERRSMGSAVKFGLLAEGSADLYPRFGPTMEWDTAAGHAVLEAAGGQVVTVSGTPLLYGKPGFLNPDFIARGAPQARRSS
ncbi:MAG: 3'(2'),5'-bisphosphate nucleotidase CysQ [Pseudomonadota bacterium]